MTKIEKKIVLLLKTLATMIICLHFHHGKSKYMFSLMNFVL